METSSLRKKQKWKKSWLQQHAFPVVWCGGKFRGIKLVVFVVGVVNFLSYISITHHFQWAAIVRLQEHHTYNYKCLCTLIDNFCALWNTWKYWKLLSLSHSLCAEETVNWKVFFWSGLFVLIVSNAAHRNWNCNWTEKTANNSSTRNRPQERMAAKHRESSIENQKHQ